MDLDMQPERRKTDRRVDGVTAKILRKVFSIRRGEHAVAVEALFAGSAHDRGFIERMLAIPEERRGRPRRKIVAAPAPASLPAPAPSTIATAADAQTVADERVALCAADMATLHRLRFESDSGMHRMTMADCPEAFMQFGLIDQERDGTPSITAKGRLTLKHGACVRALDSVRRSLDAIPMTDEVRTWLESSGYLDRKGNGYEVTVQGSRWLEMHALLPPDRRLS